MLDKRWNKKFIFIWLFVLGFYKFETVAADDAGYIFDKLEIISLFEGANISVNRNKVFSVGKSFVIYEPLNGGEGFREVFSSATGSFSVPGGIVGPVEPGVLKNLVVINYGETRGSSSCLYDIDSNENDKYKIITDFPYPVGRIRILIDRNNNKNHFQFSYNCIADAFYTFYGIKLQNRDMHGSNELKENLYDMIILNLASICKNKNYHGYNINCIRMELDALGAGYE